MLASFARCVLQAENPRNQILPSSGGPFWGEERSRGFAYLASLFAPLVVWAPPLVGWGLGSMRQYGTCRRVAAALRASLSSWLRLSRVSLRLRASSSCFM